MVGSIFQGIFGHGSGNGLSKSAGEVLGIHQGLLTVNWPSRYDLRVRFMPVTRTSVRPLSLIVSARLITGLAGRYILTS